MVKSFDGEKVLRYMMKSDRTDESDVIDLTIDSDDEAPAPKINTEGLLRRSIVDDPQPCSSKGLVATPWFPKENEKI